MAGRRSVVADPGDIRLWYAFVPGGLFYGTVPVEDWEDNTRDSHSGLQPNCFPPDQKGKGSQGRAGVAGGNAAAHATVGQADSASH